MAMVDNNGAGQGVSPGEADGPYPLGVGEAPWVDMACGPGWQRGWKTVALS